MTAWDGLGPPDEAEIPVEDTVTLPGVKWWQRKLIGGCADCGNHCWHSVKCKHSAAYRALTTDATDC